jgi:Tfp pilus assembly protein PilV
VEHAIDRDSYVGAQMMLLNLWNRRRHRSKLVVRLRAENGVTLVETLVATGILLVSMGGLASISFVATTTTENQGHLLARTTEYAQDKMEQLLALTYSDPSSDTTVFPATTINGTGLTIGGSLPPAAAVAGYVDYLDVNGNLLGGGVNAPATWYYKRVWQISSPSANLKQISVTTTVAWAMGQAAVPTSTVTALKTFPF